MRLVCQCFQLSSSSREVEHEGAGVWAQQAGQCTMKLGSITQVLAECMLKYCIVLECSAYPCFGVLLKLLCADAEVIKCHQLHANRHQPKIAAAHRFQLSAASYQRHQWPLELPQKKHKVFTNSGCVMPTVQRAGPIR